jgi:NAD(P)-dependent dehydrogenase (short-subunit alcohol dehydrogenase family)
MTTGFGLEGKVVIVTGAAGGLGREFALGFAAEGAKIVAADVQEVGIAETVKLVEQAGGPALAVTVDVTNRE